VAVEGAGGAEGTGAPPEEILEEEEDAEVRRASDLVGAGVGLGGGGLAAAA